MRAIFDKTKDGIDVHIFTIKNAQDMSVSIIEYGATVTGITVPDKSGNPVDVVLGYDTVKEYEDNTFYLLSNLEFLNDRYVSLLVNWSFDGKILNRIPLLKKMKLREYIGFKMLFSHLTDKNNPFIRTNDNNLFVFPTRDGHQTSFVMGNKPYMELSVGISNIFKVLTVQYVRRLNYNDMPDIYGGDKLKKNGIRFAVDFKF